MVLNTILNLTAWTGFITKANQSWVTVLNVKAAMNRLIVTRSSLIIVTRTYLTVLMPDLIVSATTKIIIPIEHIHLALLIT